MPSKEPKIYFSFRLYLYKSFKLLQNLEFNKATGLDRIPAKVLKLYTVILKYPVSYLFSPSFTKSISLDFFKHAKL